MHTSFSSIQIHISMHSHALKSVHNATKKELSAMQDELKKCKAELRTVIEEKEVQN